MPDRTPERLQAFRDEYAGQSNRQTGWAKIQFAILVLGISAILFMQLKNSSSQTADAGRGDGQSSTAAGHERDLATRLADRGLPHEAIAAYDRYLAVANLSDETRANVCYSVAEVAIDAGDYTTALARLYESELLAPESSLKETIDRKVVFCLEKLGRTASLRRELRHRSSMRESSANREEGDPILAEFGDEVIFRRDLERELDELPAAARSSIESPEAMADFLRNLVAERLLLDKARRLELDKDPEIQDRLAQQLDSLIVRKLIDDEIKSKSDIGQADVERFYKAEIQRFTRPPSATGVMGQGSSEEDAFAAAAGESAIRVMIRPNTVSGASLEPERAARFAEAILALEPGEVSYAVQLDDTWYAFNGALQPAVVEPFESAQGRAERMYRREKEQEALDSLMESTLSAQNTRLYLDRLDAGMSE